MPSRASIDAEDVTRWLTNIVQRNFVSTAHGDDVYPLPEGLTVARNQWYIAAWSVEVTCKPMERRFWSDGCLASTCYSPKDSLCTTGGEALCR